MFNVVGLPIENAKKELEGCGFCYKLVKYNSRFKDGVDTDSLRVVRQRQENSGVIELIVSDFKTIPQSR